MVVLGRIGTLDWLGALLAENYEVVSLDLPHELVLRLIGLTFPDLDWFAHDRKNERKDHLGCTGAPDVDVHHDHCVLLEDVVLLINETQRIENHKADLDTSGENDEGPVEADVRAIWLHPAWHALDTVLNTAHRNGEDTQGDEAAQGVEPDRNFELPEDTL